MRGRQIGRVGTLEVIDSLLSALEVVQKRRLATMHAIPLEPGVCRLLVHMDLPVGLAVL